MIKYRLTKDNKSIDFSSLNDVALFKQANPEWVNIQPVEYEEEIIPEPAIVPFDVPTWRLRAILALDNLEQSVTDALDQLTEPQKTIAKRAWDFGSKTERSSPTVDFIKGVLSLTDTQVDDIFVQAEAIQI
ncbi:MAG: hypothetical protein ACK52I_01950 [Pseudomonadota bacterium]|jgi:hypothetical protein